MPDREKVILGIDMCLRRFCCSADCPYHNEGCMEQLREDALELLKGSYGDGPQQHDQDV